MPIKQPTPESGEAFALGCFRIVAVVAPVSGLFSWCKDKPFELDKSEKYKESITFDMEMDRILHAMRCTCLGHGTTCIQREGHEHWIVEWTQGSELQTNEWGCKKTSKGRPYGGRCKASIKAHISGTETICCIEK
jgi:hypothetical protein